LKQSIDFERFFKDNYARYFYFALQFIPNPEECKDIVSDAFEYAWKETARGNRNVVNWNNYMYSCIRNKCIDYIRHKMVEEKHAAFYLQMYQEGTDYEELDERIRTMYRMLDDLAPKTRLILRECYLHKKSYKEVAEELGVTTDAVKKHIVKALKTLRGKISKIDPEEST